MTLRHIYKQLSGLYLKGSDTRFPIYVNLRDHFGQTEPAEALIRHGTQIGMPQPNQLVAAWLAGHVHVLLDGFDELSSTRFARGFKGLKQARREAMRLVHNFSENHPSSTSLLISGREHYFDSIDEMQTALGLPETAVVFSLNEFTQEQIQDYLKRKGFRQTVPDWLPSRPLLLGYLMVKGILSSADMDLASLSREQGWNYLLDRVCEREARQIDPVSIDPKAVREFVERLSTIARKSSSGRGPINLTDIDRVFQEIFDTLPDEKAEILIFRMPGFTTSSGQNEAREFIDDDFVDACRAGDVYRFVKSPHDTRYEGLLLADIPMGELGCALAALRLSAGTSKQISAAVQAAAQKAAPYLGVDLVRILQELNLDFTESEVTFSDGFFANTLETLPTPDLRNINFRECYFSNIEITGGAAVGPTFQRCEIAQIVGAVTEADLPKEIFLGGNNIGDFTNEAATNADIMDLPLPLAVKVTMTILRKLFIQAGRGRKESALFRGLDSRGRAYVPEILNEIDRTGFATPHRLSGPNVWIPNRTLAKEARAILSAPRQSGNPLITWAFTL